MTATQTDTETLVDFSTDPTDLEIYPPTGDELRALLGERHINRFIKWLPHPFGNAPAKNNGFSGAFWAPVWFGYRRLQVDAILCYVRAIGMAIVFGIAFAALGWIGGQGNIDGPHGFCVGLVVGFGATDIAHTYCQNLREVITTGRRRFELNSPEHLQWLEGKGGKSTLAGICHTAMMVTIISSAFYITILPKYWR